MNLANVSNLAVQMQQLGMVQGFAYCPGLAAMGPAASKRHDPIDRLIETEKSKHKPALQTLMSDPSSQSRRVPCSVPILAGRAKYCELHYLKWMERSTVRRPEFAHGGSVGEKSDVESERPKKGIYIYGSAWLSTDGCLLGMARNSQQTDGDNDSTKTKSSVFANDRERMEKMKAQVDQIDDSLLCNLFLAHSHIRSPLTFVLSLATRHGRMVNPYMSLLCFDRKRNKTGHFPLLVSEKDIWLTELNETDLSSLSSPLPRTHAHFYTIRV